jgi:hypothetical protein
MYYDTPKLAHDAIANNRTTYILFLCFMSMIYYFE